MGSGGQGWVKVGGEGGAERGRGGGGKVGGEGKKLNAEEK